VINGKKFVLEEHMLKKIMGVIRIRSGVAKDVFDIEENVTTMEKIRGLLAAI
jgi:hypothetical protein